MIGGASALPDKAAEMWRELPSDAKAAAIRRSFDHEVWINVLHRSIETQRRALRGAKLPGNESKLSEVLCHAESFFLAILASIPALLPHHSVLGRIVCGSDGVELQCGVNIVALEMCQGSARKAGDQQLERCALVAACRALIHMGDVARYRRLHCTGPGVPLQGSADGWEQAHQYYVKALRLNPRCGNAYNQLAVLATHREAFVLACMHYCCALSALEPFDISRGNLLAMLRSKALTLRRARPQPEFDGEPQAVGRFSATSLEDLKHAFFQVLIPLAQALSTQNGSAQGSSHAIVSDRNANDHQGGDGGIHGRGLERTDEGQSWNGAAADALRVACDRAVSSASFTADKAAAIGQSFTFTHELVDHLGCMVLSCVCISHSLGPKDATLLHVLRFAHMARRLLARAVEFFDAPAVQTCTHEAQPPEAALCAPPVASPTATWEATRDVMSQISSLLANLSAALVFLSSDAVLPLMSCPEGTSECICPQAQMATKSLVDALGPALSRADAAAQALARHTRAKANDGAAGVLSGTSTSKGSAVDGPPAAHVTTSHLDLLGLAPTSGSLQSVLRGFLAATNADRTESGPPTEVLAAAHPGEPAAQVLALVATIAACCTRITSRLGARSPLEMPPLRGCTAAEASADGHRPVDETAHGLGRYNCYHSCALSTTPAVKRPRDSTLENVAGSDARAGVLSREYPFGYLPQERSSTSHANVQRSVNDRSAVQTSAPRTMAPSMFAWLPRLGS